MKLVKLGVWLVSLGVIVFPSLGEAAVVSGKILFQGTAPQAQKLDLNADPACAAQHPDGLNSEEVVVNPDGALANVFVYVKEGLSAKDFPAPSEPVTMDQKGCHYVPHVFGIRVNQPLEIVNSDMTLHNVHAMPEQNAPFNLGMPIQGMKFKKSFDKPEVMVKVKCDVHPWMSAYAGVLDHPFFAVSNEEGTFAIKDLPPGQYTLEAWHEKYGVQSQTVSVASAEEAKEANFNYSEG